MRLLVSDHFLQRGDERNFNYNVLRKGLTIAKTAQIGEEIKVNGHGSSAILRKTAEDLVIAVTGWSRHKKPVTAKGATVCL